MVPLGEAILPARTDRGISQEKLANMTGIERSHMGRIERGEGNVSFLNLLNMAAALKTDLSAIIKRAGF